MKRLARIILILSLLGNLILAVAIGWKRQAAEAKPGRTRGASDPVIQKTERPPAARADAGGITRDKARAFDPRSLDALSEYKNLLAAGYSKTVARMVVLALIEVKHGLTAAQKVEARADKSRFFKARWEQAHVDSSADWRELQILNDAPALQLRYGDLPPATIAAVIELEARFDQKPDHALAAALQGVLTPAQQEDYLKYNSLLARVVQQTVSAVDIDQATYEALWTAAVAREKSAAPAAEPKALTERNYAPASVRQYREILGATNFLKIIGNIQSSVAWPDAIYAKAGLSEDLRADLFLEAYTSVHERYAVPRERQQDRLAETNRSIREKTALPAELQAEIATAGSALPYLGRGGWTLSGTPRR